MTKVAMEVAIGITISGAIVAISAIAARYSVDAHIVDLPFDPLDTIADVRIVVGISVFIIIVRTVRALFLATVSEARGTR